GMKPKACALKPRSIPLSTAAGLLVVLDLALPAGSRAATPVGLWYAEGGAAQVAIAPCGAALCGEVAWLRSPFGDDGWDLRDRRNPDPLLRRRRILGLTVLEGLRAESDSTWTSGTIYDPSTGNTYSCRLTLEGADRLLLRGYLGIPLIGRTTT